ncbi:MAG TPA: diacylglycerol kinase family protein [Vicinamibacterales bacterium]|jgi:YegS/Rv2252/BmrU family lipid kinase|nr:diacylglycerol kinase family protein [Vicinamibacterales bacterium]
MSVAIIINPISGGARPGAARVRAQIALSAVDRHGDRAEVFVTERPGHARALAKAAARRGVRLVLAWGGDGTVNEIASALAFDSVPLGIIPSGSGNGLARELGISRRPDRAIAAALAAAPRAIDLGELDGRLFVNVAGIGIDAYVAAQFNGGGNLRRGLIGYARITGRALFSYAPQAYRIASDHARFDTRAVVVTIANGAQYGNNARIAPDARVDDGLLDLVVVEERSRWETLRHVPKLFNGQAARVPGYRTTRIRRATIESDDPMPFHVDGEPVQGGTSLKVRVHPGALLVAAR